MKENMYWDIVKSESELKKDGVQWYYYNSDGVCIAEEFKKHGSKKEDKCNTIGMTQKQI